MSISYSKAIHKSPETAASRLSPSCVAPVRHSICSSRKKSATESAVQILEDFVVARRFISEVEKGKRNEEKRRVGRVSEDGGEREENLFQFFISTFFVFAFLLSSFCRSRWGCELKYFHTHPSTQRLPHRQTPTESFFSHLTVVVVATNFELEMRREASVGEDGARRALMGI